jgi:beta-galactosidase
LDLPHDWAIEGPFRADIENETGKLPWVGIGWYRKTFTLPASAAGRRHYLDVDGAMAQPKVFINGVLAGEWKYGYSSFRVDLTPHLKFGVSNTIAIRLENLPSSTRWYPGAGVYRHVWWVDAPQIHLEQWGVYVTTPEVSDEQASVVVESTVENHSAPAVQLTVQQEVLDPSGKVVATANSRVRITGHGASVVVTNRLTVARPQRWDLAHPRLYTLRTTVRDGRRELDVSETPFGIRTSAWDAEQGFLLNGRKLVLQGVCNHHDLGTLVAAVHTRAIERQIEILQEMGCNAIRTSHNPPAPELLELCDRIGMLVIDELFDVWKMQKYGKVNGYNLYWDDWHEKDARNFVQRDCNHPSIIAWSMGNEVAELSTPSMHWVPAKLRELIRQYDFTRPITTGANYPAAAWNGFQKTVDVFGLNYHLSEYERVADALPDMPLYASETASTVSTRGEYFFPAVWDKSKGFYQFQVSSYDLYAPGWACRPDLEFEALDQHPRFAGEFVWTVFDYLGEPTPYNQDQTVALNFADAKERERAMEELRHLGNRAPSRNSYFGILDLCGFKKDRFFFYQARWRPELPVAYLLPHWNWPERVGEITPVHAYINGDEGELFLNGRSLGKRKIGEPHRYRLVWEDVKYEPGKLEIIVTKAGKLWAKAARETTGEPARLEVISDRAEIVNDGCDLSYVTIRVLDAQGREVPRTRLPVDIIVRGPVEIAGIGNGDTTHQTPMKPANPDRARITAFNGLAQVIVRSQRGQLGTARLMVSAAGLPTVEAIVALKP